VTELKRPFQFTLGAAVMCAAGGGIGGVFWALGQEKEYRCENCPRIFFAHTRTSRVFRILAIITYCIVAVVVLWALVLMIKN